MRMLGARVVLTPRAEKGVGMYMKAALSRSTPGFQLAAEQEARMAT